ncbi:MAG: hypothetical protein DRI22_04530 [Caldiserica bacterium]|nr:MAG: hypothetical protein DRI22_04530 [Caldisericota bacterium]
MNRMRAKSIFFSILINLFIFSSLPILHNLFHRPVSLIEPIQIDLFKPEIKKIVRKRSKPDKLKKIIKRRKMIKPELRRRIDFELTPDALSTEVDLIAPYVTYDLSEVDQLPCLIKYIKPEYPEEARVKGIEGVVQLKILIDREGRVAAVKVLNDGGFYEFGRVASQAVKRWRYEPAKIMGMPVAVWCIQSVRFELEKR